MATLRKDECEEGRVMVELLMRAQDGDSDAYARLVSPHRRELHVHCYRILGSVQDAEDALQETLLAAWRALNSFEERASLRTWLYRIATNRCLNMLRAGSPRLRGYEERPDLLLPVATAADEPLWLEPYPDQLLDELPDNAPGPEPRYEMREAISLAFITALQVLPARQRACLILHDVLGFRAREVAAMLESTEESVTSALKRARAKLEQRLDKDAGEAAPAPGSLEEREFLERFTTAFEGSDVDALIAMLTDDVRLSMPPLPFEYRGLDAATQLLSRVLQHPPRRRRVVYTRANGQPAFAVYVLDERDGVFRSVGLIVATLAGTRVARLTRFETSMLADFGLPRTLPG
jgi:RNA polymerase sigma-70 factor (TIGR02960 family)